MLSLTIRKLYLIIISLIFAFYNVHAQNEAWTKKAAASFTPRSGAAACVVNGKIYVIGGIDSGYKSLAVNEMYDPLTNTWTKKQPMPTARGFLAAAVVNNIIYAIGGGTPLNALKAVEIYDPVHDTWAKKTDMPYPDNEMQAGVVDGIIYVIGGAFDKRYCLAYDPVTDKWSQKNDRPEIGGYITVTVYNNLLYTFGGSHSPYGQIIPRVYAYDPKADSWTKKKDMPTGKFGFQTYLVKDKIYALGGSPSTSGTLSAVEVYSPSADSWRTKPNMPNPLAYFAGAAVNDKIYVISGTPDFLRNTEAVWEYDPLFHTDIASGNVSGKWTKESSPYYINGQITIPDNAALTIEPGVHVVFTGHYKFNVLGRLVAIGTKENQINFLADNQDSGWHGLRFINTPNTNDTSKLDYCSFTYGKANTGLSTGWDRSGGALMIRGFDKVKVSRCLFKFNISSGDMLRTGGSAVYISNASPVITKSTFINNSGNSDGAIRCDSASKAVISNNVISNNTGSYGPVMCANTESNTPEVTNNIISDNQAALGGGGVFIYRYSKPLIANNIIVNNKASLGGGIYCQQYADPVFINNTVGDNTASLGNNLTCHGNSSPIFINTILHQNPGVIGNQVYIIDGESDPQFFYCNVQGGLEVFAGNGARSNYTGLYQNNIKPDPKHLTAPLNFYELDGRSPCIGAGIDSIKVSGKWYHAPEFCIKGNPRPTPYGSKPDIGACENISAKPGNENILNAEQQSLTQPKEFALWQNYPNPFNPATLISFQLPVSGHVKLTVFDVLGNEITTLVNEVKPAGTYNISFRGENLSSGVYFYRIKAGSYVETKKMILLR